MLPTSPFTSPLTKEDEKQIQIRIDRAKIALMMEKATTFFSALLSNLKLVLDRSHSTAATDAIHLWMNPDFVCDLPEDHLLGVMLHEIMHIVLDHCNFQVYKDLDQYVIGIAMDHHINLYITALGYTLPSFAFCDTKFTNMSTMQIYHELMKDPPQKPPNWLPDVIGKPEGMSDEEYKEKIDTILIKAVLQAQMANDVGSIPGHIKIKVEELTAPQLPWNITLLKYMDQYSRDDYNYSRPNRRYAPAFYLPQLQGERIRQVTFGLDVSGSMTDGELEEGVAECRYIRELMQPEFIHVMTFDTEVHLNEIYEEYNDMPLAEVEGGGGTIIEPLLERIAIDKPLFAIIFTDGYFGDPDMSDIESDIYWVIKGNPGFRPPDGVGEVIHLN